MSEKSWTLKDEAVTTVALAEWVALSGAADNQASRDLWQDCLETLIQLSRRVSADAGQMKGRSRTTLKRIIESCVNLVASLSWLDQDDKQRYLEALHGVHSALAREG